ncbi:aminoglycoside phosphotransferase family protein [Micromonospora sp. RHAY321]|uniref:phosphotransferase enzyme family protein n=1 Tax=Micromonospora sp. RHAY321 TaxID=2944807 RepID=UPI00207C8586|nr:aminoglycoside phosphotransferase family protein [Micromonospora sp. RHAY321]MCO1596885.1 aminoglycoside phosphotransferase family protein [Micromonospora sp. RHAY321]
MIEDASRQVATWVQADFGIELTTMDEVTHGADQHARLWRAGTADGSRYAVKVSGGGTPAGLVVAAHLAEQKVPGIPAPLRTHDGRLCGDREGRRLSVVPWVSHRRALDGPMTGAHWRAYGELLAAVHAVPVTDELARRLPAGGATYPTIVAATRAMAERLRDPDPADPAGPLLTELAAVWAAAAQRVSTLVEGVERRSGARPGPVVVCHGDPHLGNLLLGPGGQVWLIDWDDAVLAPPECDLMFVIGGVLAFAPITAEQQAAALAGYGRADVDRARLAWFLAVRALDDLTDWTRQALDTEASAADRIRAAEIVRGLVSPVGLVTLADAALRGLDPRG